MAAVQPEVQLPPAQQLDPEQLAQLKTALDALGLLERCSGAHLGILLRLGFTDLASFMLSFARRRTAPVSTVLQADGLPAAELAQGIQRALERVLATARGNAGGVAGRGVVAAPGGGGAAELVAVTAAPVLVGHGGGTGGVVAAGPPPAATLVPAGNPAAKGAPISL